MIKYKKKTTLLAIILMLAPVFIPYGLVNSKEAVKANRMSHTELCCCGHVANTCRNCGCQDVPAKPDKNGNYPITITSCSGSSDDIVTTPRTDYFFSQSVFLNYLPVATLSETVTLQLKDVLNKPPNKPPISQLLTNFIII